MKQEKKPLFKVGIDEVGRGALAGPVVVGAVAIISSKRIVFPRIMGKLKDSKKLSPRKREMWFEYFKKNADIMFTTARVYPRGIEKMNISKAANKAALRAVERLFATGDVSFFISCIHLDGGLYVGNRKTGAKYGNSGKEIWGVKTIIRGDEKITAIKMASIVAKVSRDKYMTRLAKKHPEYGFEIHKGYGTKAHFRALRKYGPTSAHRSTFCPKTKLFSL